MHKIGIMGDRDSVLGFMALGFSVHEVTDREEAAALLHTLVRAGDYAVLYITEELAIGLEEEIAKYKDLPLPAIVSLPGATGSTGYGTACIRSAVERAVGADIIFRE